MEAGPTVAVISTGDELLLGDVVDTNGAEISRRLAAVGLRTVLRITVGDDESSLKSALGDAVGRADVVVMTGGLGPTDDDLTRFVVSDFFSLPLVVNEEAQKRIMSVLSRVGVSVGEAEMRQALIPRTATVIPNEHGTASGFYLKSEMEGGKRHFFCLSGVPFEMRQMLDSFVIPTLKNFFGNRLRPLLLHRFNTIGFSESEVASLVRSLKLPEGVSVSYRASDYIVSVTFYGETEKALDEAVRLFRGAVEPKKLLSEGDVRPQEALFATLKERNASIAVAESFTGGLITDRISDVAGASDFLRGGIVAYTEGAKTELLGVSEETIKEKTVYSEEVAIQMARGVRDVFEADYGLATTGVAGPSDVSPKAPAGLCFFAICGKKTELVRRMRIVGDRRAIKRRAANVAMNLLRLAVKDSV